MKGYKVFNSDWTCKKFQFKVGETFEEDVTPRCRDVGFHFCTNIADCFSYYDFNPNNKVAEVEALGQIDTSDKDSKCSTNKIKIIRELSWQEVLNLVNTGKENTGLGNSGDCNSGDCNSGNWNSGDYNSGNRNSGYFNSGSFNSGNWNSGDCNKGNYNSGFFNSTNAKVRLFNHSTDIDFNDDIILKLKKIIRKIPQSYTYSDFIDKCNMSDDEKIEHPEYKTLGGYTKVITKEADKWKWLMLASN